MEAIGNLLKQVNVDGDTATDFIKLFQSYPEIARFIEAHKLSDEAIMANALPLLQYKEYLEQEQQGKLDNPTLEGYIELVRPGVVSFMYRYNASYSELQKLREYISCWNMEEHILRADIQDFTKQAVISAAAKKAIIMIMENNKGIPPQRGLFISGLNGVGKTHLLAAIAKEFASQKKRTIIVFWPELLREIKQNPYQADKIVKQLQRIPVLMIDDLGAEMQTSFGRDEILLPILNARMNNQRLTYFSSNLDMPSLENHFKQTQYGETEPIKAKRMMERIYALSEYTEMLGENQRRK